MQSSGDWLIMERGSQELLDKSWTDFENRWGKINAEIVYTLHTGHIKETQLMAHSPNWSKNIFFPLFPMQMCSQWEVIIHHGIWDSTHTAKPTSSPALCQLTTAMVRLTAGLQLDCTWISPPHQYEMPRSAVDKSHCTQSNTVDSNSTAAQQQQKAKQEQKQGKPC